MNQPKDKREENQKLPLAGKEPSVNQPKETDLIERKEKLELLLVEKELLLKEKELKKRNPILIGIVVAIIGLFSNSLVSFINGRNQIQHTKQLLENQLIINALNSNDIEQNKENLKLLTELEFITYKKEVIQKVLKDTAFSPILDLSGLKPLKSLGEYWEVSPAEGWIPSNSNPQITFTSDTLYRVKLSPDSGKISPLPKE